MTINSNCHDALKSFDKKPITLYFLFLSVTEAQVDQTEQATLQSHRHNAVQSYNVVPKMQHAEHVNNLIIFNSMLCSPHVGFRVRCISVHQWTHIHQCELAATVVSTTLSITQQSRQLDLYMITQAIGMITFTFNLINLMQVWLERGRPAQIAT